MAPGGRESCSKQRHETAGLPVLERTQFRHIGDDCKGGGFAETGDACEDFERPQKRRVGWRAMPSLPSRESNLELQ